ncbi:hypothetical protein Tco_1381533 [Tanacetum coccineum]
MSDSDDHEYLELPWMPEDPYVEAALQDPPSSDYVPGPEESEHAPPSPDYVPGPEHADDEIVVEDQPYAEDASPTTQSPDYVPESDPEADPKEDDDEDPEEDSVDYTADGGDDKDDENEPSEEDEDDDVDIEANEDEEEVEHPAPADSTVVALPAADQAPSAEETEPFETDESAATPPPYPAYRVTARISIPAPVPTPVWSDAEVARLLAISTPPSSSLSPWSSPLLNKWTSEASAYVTNTLLNPIPFEDLSDIGSPRADDHEYLELPWMLEDPYVKAALQAPPSPDYVPGPDEPEQAPPSPDYVPGPEHTDDEIVAEDQPDAEDASPTTQSPDYVPESDPKADPEEDDEEDPEEDPVDYYADGVDDGDDDDEPLEEDEDDDVDMEADEDEEEEEHPAPTDSVVVALPAADQAPSAEETESFKTDESAATPPPHLAYRETARISIPAPVPTPVWFDAEVARLLAISTPPSSPLSPWSSPLPQIPSPPLPPIPSPSLPLSPPSHVLSPAPPPSPIRSLGYLAAMIRLRAENASTSHSLPLPHPFILSPTKLDAPSSRIPPPLPISVPTSSPPLLLPFSSRREDRPEVTLPPRKRLGIALGPRYEVGESSSAAARPAGGLRADYGFVATMDREIRRDPEREVGYGIIDSWDEIDETL